MTKSVFTEQYSELLRLLLAAREAANLTQRDVAARLEKPQSFVSKYELGQRRIDVIEFFDIARALEIDPFELLHRLFSDIRKP
jgi:transcriptional regulator with XRE-family HTH domain